MEGKTRKDINELSSRNTVLFGVFARERYLPFIRENKRSWKTDERYLERHILPFLGNYDLSEIDAEVLYRWRDVLLDSGLSASTCYRLFWLVKYMLNCAVRWHILTGDASFCEASCPRGKPGRPVLLTEEEKRELVALLEQYADRPASWAVHLLLLTGATSSEILYARWKDVDPAGRVLVTSRTPSGNAQAIALSDEALRLLARLPRQKGVPWLFFHPATGNRLVSVFAFWKKIRTELGRPELRLNDLRHSFVRSLLDKGASYREVRKRLGHYSSDIFSLQAKQGGSDERISF